MAQSADIVIVGGGLAGASAAVMLGRADLDVMLIDPYDPPRPDFRCEKLDPSQVRLLRRMGLAGLVLPAATHNRELWVARLGRLADKMAIDQYGILYQPLVRAVRQGIPPRVRCLRGTVAAIALSEDEQTVSLVDGEVVTARLVVLANGLNRALRSSLGIECRTISANHSITIGFDVVPRSSARFPFDSLTYYGERPQDRTAYLTLFRLGTVMRANLMTYRDMDDPWLKAIREEPEAALASLMPRLGRLIGPYAIQGPVRVRPADLYVAANFEQPGLVLVGDAFATSCPAAGTGTNKVLSDVERLCAVHVPRWMETPGMSTGKLASFYADPEKRATDLYSSRAAFALKARSLADGPLGYAGGYSRYLGRLAKGTARRWLRRLAALSQQASRLSWRRRPARAER
ncbi:MAG TPA: FAD-dependent monooxygenase [Bosea sp. (in: a-proteobacteria)]|jgi:2-polyprenyl-6-methoxyphenol hydroxylase-like FAD-dependent oxidoreductase|uniref:FAD-dependent oxidoreductase n=1 Tax=Bosea sp. (in: a-proteobacteria) TaxID=1871050 RepID=UPI002E0E68BA|nr:FAD-dependent monooxygenase [Bosea sp. (in: a-proteobacteria)]